MDRIRSAVRLMGVGSAAILATHVYAAGYNFGVQSVSAQGVANAGGAAAMDATTIFYNPAGMTYLPGDNISAAMVVASPHVKVSNLQASTAFGKPVGGSGTGSSPTSATVVPQFYMTHQINDKFFAGLGLFVPFGDKTKYDGNWNGRYNGTALDMKTFAVNPQLAYKLNDKFSLGVGLTAQYMNAEFSKNVDFGTMLNSSPGSGQYDGKFSYEGKDWGFGWNMGAMWQIDETLRVGAAYRSSITYELSGNANWALPTLPALATGYLQSLGYKSSPDGKVKIKTPDSFSLNFYKEVNPKLAVMGDWTYTRHSKFEELRLDYSNNLPDAVIEQKWKNTNRYALGMTYKVSDPLTLRFGLAYDQSPVSGDDLRIAVLPDSSRIWYSFGVNYAFSKNVSVDVAYTYEDIKNGSMNNRECSAAQGCTGSGTLTQANFKSYANIFGVQLNYRF